MQAWLAALPAWTPPGSTLWATAPKPGPPAAWPPAEDMALAEAEAEALELERAVLGSCRGRGSVRGGAGR